MNQVNKKTKNQTNKQTNEQTRKYATSSGAIGHSCFWVSLLITFAQVHYASVDHIPPEGDDSGVFLQYTEQVESMNEQEILQDIGLIETIWEPNIQLVEMIYEQDIILVEMI